MTRREFVAMMAACVLTASFVLAQTGNDKADVISGTWTGELAPKSGPPPAAVTFQLKFDGKSAVTGTFTGLPSPGDVKKGTFDPKTGALQLQLGKVEEPDVLLTLDGTVANGVASGTFTGELAGDFKITRKN